MASPTIRILVEALTKDAERNLRGLQKTVKDTGNEGTKSGKAFDGFKTAIGAVGIIAGGAVAGVVALKKALEFGKEGAAILQTEESFGRLMDSLGRGPGVLDALRAASLGTVDDMTLMSSTLTLVAGASENLAGAMVDASPRLMDIAKAAHKLNPRLGTTAHMYESLALGIKRASPMILDNLGLTIKVGEANEKYAAKLGKTVDGLTAEEKQMALLNAALEAGDTLIGQVGGNTEEMGDSFAQAETKIKNATDRMKTKLVPVLADVADALADGLDLALNHATAVSKVADAAVGAADSYDDYLKAFKEYAEEAGMFRGVAEGQIEDLFDYAIGADKGTISTKKLAREIGILTEEQYNAKKAFDTLTGGMENFTHATDVWIERAEEENTALLKLDAGYEEHRQALVNNTDALANQAAKAGLARQKADELAEAEQAAALAAEAAAAAQDAFAGSLDLLHAAISGEFGQSVEDYIGTIEDLDQALADGEITRKDYRQAIDDEAQAFRDNTTAIMYNIAEKMILDALEKGLIEDVNASGTAYDEATDALWAMAYQMGLVDEETLALWTSTQDLTQGWIDGEYSAGILAGKMVTLSGRLVTAAGDSEKLAGTFSLWEGEHKIELTHNFPDANAQAQAILDNLQNIQGTYTAYVQISGGLGGGAAIPTQMGGPVAPGTTYLVGEAGPELFVPAAPGYVVPNHELNSATNHNYNLTINTSAPAEAALVDFDIIKSLAGV